MNINEDILRASVSILSIAKLLYDHGKLDILFDYIGSDTDLSWDSQCLVEQCACQCVFQDTRIYHHEGKKVSHTEYEEDRDTFVLRDPLLNRFDQLCREYEAKYGISRIENNFVRQMENAVHVAMQFPNYCYDYLWIDGTKDRKGPKLVLFLFEEFESYERIPEALCAILDACAYEISQLEEKLAQPADKVIPLPLTPSDEQKEAA